jgi:hypothetical protein
MLEIVKQIINVNYTHSKRLAKQTNNELRGSIHQTTNYESTHFLANIKCDFFFNWQSEKKNCFAPIRSLLSFSTAQTEKPRFVKKIGENKICCLVV